MSLLIVAMDNTIVNVALPSIRRDLHASLSGLQWTIDAYTIVLASLLMLGRLDRRPPGAPAHLPDGPAACSRRLAAVQPGPDARLADRRPRRAGGRRLDAQPGGDVDHHQRLHRAARARPRDRRVGRGRRHQPRARADRRRRADARRVGWRAIFWINVPIALAAVVLTALFVPESRAPRARAASTRSARCS